MSQVIAESQSLGLGRYGTILKRRRFIVLLGLLLGLVAAVGYLEAAPTHSTAYTLVNITVISTDPFNSQKSPSELIDSQTELQSARSSTVMTAAKLASGETRTIREMRADLDVTLLQNGTVVRITYQAPTAKAARAGADAVARAYLDYRSTEADRRRDAITEQLSGRQNELIADLNLSNNIVASSAPGSAARIRAESRVQAIVAEISALTTQINTYTGLDTNGGSVLTAATDNPTTTSPRRVLTVASGVGAGLLLGLVGAFLVNVLDRRVRDDYDVAGARAARVIGTLSGGHVQVPAVGDDRDTIAAARERLLADFDPGGGVLAIIDLTRGHEPSDASVNLALLLAESHQGCDLMLPEWPEDQLERLLRALGVDELGADKTATIEDLGLRIITRAEGVDDHSRGGGWMTQLRDSIGENDPHRCLVIAVPPHGSRAVRLAAVRLADATLLVAELLATRIGDLARQATDMQAVHTRVSGTLLVGHRRTIDWTEPTTEASSHDPDTDPGPGADVRDLFDRSGDADGPPSRGRLKRERKRQRAPARTQSADAANAPPTDVEIPDESSDDAEQTSSAVSDGGPSDESADPVEQVSQEMARIYAAARNRSERSAKNQRARG